MKITYSPETNMAYIYFEIETIPKPDWGDSFEIEDIIEFSTLYLEFDKNNILIGIEIASADTTLPAEILNQTKERFEDTPTMHDIPFQRDKKKDTLFLDFTYFQKAKKARTKKYSVPDIFKKGTMNLELDDAGMIWGMEFTNATNILPKSFLQSLKTK